jgi:hypothetical protein
MSEWVREWMLIIHRWTGKELERNGLGLLELMSLHLSVGSEETIRSWVRIVAVLAKILSENLRNACQERYRYANLLIVTAWSISGLLPGTCVWYFRSHDFVCFFICIVGGGTESTRHVGHWMAYCTCPGWLWWWRIWCSEDWQGKPKYSEKTCPSATLSTTNPTCQNPGSNPGFRGGKPATNGLSYGAAFVFFFCVKLFCGNWFK